MAFFVISVTLLGTVAGCSNPFGGSSSQSQSTMVGPDGNNSDNNGNNSNNNGDSNDGGDSDAGTPDDSTNDSQSDGEGQTPVPTPPDDSNDSDGSDATPPSQEQSIPNNSGVPLPKTIADSIPDSAMMVSPQYAQTSDGKIYDIATGKEVTDPTVVGTYNKPPDPLAKSSGSSFIPVSVGEVRKAMKAAQATTSAYIFQNATSDSNDSHENRAVSATDVSFGDGTNGAGRTNVQNVALQNSSYGPYWGTYNSTPAFFQKDKTRFVQQAKGVIDVSEYQGTIDWSKVKSSGVQGAIIRIGYGENNLDPKAKANIAGCKKYGIPFGIYLYSYASDSSFASREGSDLVTMLKNAGVTPSTLKYPVFYDLEYWTWTGHTPPSSPSVYDGIVNAWYSAMQKGGYKNLGVYSYTSYLQTSLNTSNIHSKTRWVAQYGPTMQYASFGTNDRGWQYMSTGKVGGITGNVDLNAFGNDQFASTTMPKCDSKVSGVTCVYELTNVSTNYQMFTSDLKEATSLAKSGWNYNGIPFYAYSKQVSGTVPVYRLAAKSGERMWTTDTTERNSLMRTGWSDEGIAFYEVSAANTTNQAYPVYRLYGSYGHVFTTDSKAPSGYKSEGIAFGSPSDVAAAPAIAGSGTRKNIYRVDSSKEHFYTTSLSERDSLVKTGWRYEGVLATSSVATTKYPMYRLSKKSGGTHMFTGNASERSSLIKSGAWKDEGIAWYNDSGTVTIYRLNNSKTSQHFWTASYTEAVSDVKAGWASEGYGWDSSKLTGVSSLYRMYNPNSSEHFYTHVSNEALSLVKAGWNAEGIGWTEPTKGSSVYRVYNPNSGLHFWTTNANEKNHLVGLGWRYEGVSWYTKASGKSVYRLYDPNNGQHFWTLSAGEKNTLVKLGWRYEGVNWHAL
jgi:GH25 family lysozyme M1 (1,4-beta-N-acetylmuramidase)